jgi:AraC-like DNA-binding protein
VAVAIPIHISSHSSETSWWEMARAEPPRDLSALVVGCLGYEEEHRGVLRRREVPFAGVPVILGFGSKPYEIHTADSVTPHVTASVFTAGLHDRPSITTQRGLQQGVQLDLTPLGAYQLFGIPMRDVAGQVLPLDELMGRDAERLVDELASSPDWATRFAVLERFMRARLDDAPQVDPAVAWAWAQLERSAGGVRVADLADEIGWSRRHFANRFAEQVGMAPKATARMLRFRRATQLLDRLDQSGTRTLADIAFECGYSDHSHFDRDFRAMAGCTPTQYLASAIPDDGGIVA